MTMTPEEICRHYQQAANPRRDIQVLADLNATDSASIREILIDAGLLEPGSVEQTPKSRDRMREAILAGLDAGLSNGEIMRESGCSKSTVRRYRRIRQDGTTEAPPAPPAVPSAPPVASPAPGKRPGAPREPIYGRIDQILTALPEDASAYAKSRAAELCIALFREALGARLGVEL